MKKEPQQKHNNAQTHGDLPSNAPTAYVRMSDLAQAITTRFWAKFS